MHKRLLWILGAGALLTVVVAGVAHGPRIVSAYAKTQTEIMSSARAFNKLESKAKSKGLILTEPQPAEYRHPNYDLFENLASLESVKKATSNPKDFSLGKHIVEDPKVWVAVNAHLKEFGDFPPTYGPRAAINAPRQPFQDRIITSLGEYAKQIAKNGDVAGAMARLEQLNDFAKILALDPRRANIISLFALNRDFGFTAEHIINSGKASAAQLARIQEMASEPTPNVAQVFGAEVVELSSLMEGIHDYLPDEIKALNSEGRSYDYPPMHKSAAKANRAKLLKVFLDLSDRSEQLADSELAGITLDELLAPELEIDTVDRYAMRTLALVYEQYGRIARRSAQIRAVVGIAASGAPPAPGTTVVTLGSERIPIEISKKGSKTLITTRSSVHDVDFVDHGNLAIQQASGIQFTRH